FSFYFQQELPVLKSSLTAQVPDWIGYAAVAQGGSYEKIKNAGPRKWVYENGEAIQDEAFVSGIMDYADKLMFQLDSYLDRSTGRVVKVSETWESLTKEFFAEKYLSRKYAKDKDVQAMAQVLCAGLSEPEEKMIRLYRYVRNRIAFNGDRSIVYRDKLSDVLEAGEGSSAAINLLLREMLQGVGIEASPVLISTRNHGRVFKDYPMINQFNHLICYAKIGEEEHFLDATNPFRPYDLLAFNDLNGLGWLLDKQNPKWVQIPDHYIDRKLIQGFLTITPQGGLKGEINIEVDGYIAQSYRSYLARNDEEKFLQRYFKADLGADVISSASISNADQPDKSMKIVLQIDAEQYIDLSGPKAYFNPLLTFGETENPFL
ncbi:MAG: transglutaminase-like domain-containing protein, partial [Bacteroidota bacterium]